MTTQHLALLSLPFIATSWLCCLLLVIGLARNLIDDYIDGFVGLQNSSIMGVRSREIQGYAVLAMQTVKGVVAYRINVEVQS